MPDTFTQEPRAGGLSGVRSIDRLGRPEIVVRPDLNRAAEHGVSSATISEPTRTDTRGGFDSPRSKLNRDSRQIGNRVHVPYAVRADIAALASLRVASRDGLEPLVSVATFAVERGPAQIDRYERRRYVAVTADLGSCSLGEGLTITHGLRSVRNMLPAVWLMQSGDAEVAAELSCGLTLAIVTGILCMFCVLVLPFKDFFQLITILLAIPLSLGGGVIVLLQMGSQLDVPIALARGADASFRQPMAIAVIGRLITSTLLSLVIRLVVFGYIHDFEGWLTRCFRAPRATDGLADGPTSGTTRSRASVAEGMHP
ncbi:efflux RND transporter permease subunit [Variovorax sp. LT2P21]|uniref:efflux RND transporter permease subunit n=1 Tax=Variovorax sp. LT2P21 TaxID=3443731 RepID=UPI003F47CA78